MGKRYLRLGAVFLMVRLFLLACAGTEEKTSGITEEIAKLFSGKYSIDPAMSENPPRTVAVLPFENLTQKEEAFEIVRKSFYNHFSSLNFVDREIFKVDDILKREGLDTPEKIKATKPQDLGKLFNVDAIIYGEITHYDRLYLALYSQVTVGARLKMVDTKTGKPLWSAEDKASKRTGGISASPVGLVLTAISTALIMRKIELLRSSDDLFRDLVKTIPNPTLAAALKPPKITILVQDAVGVPKKLGDVIKVAMEGDSNMRASFDIGIFKKGIPMEEVETGSYVGEYKVMPADNVEEAIITGYLKDESGNQAKWIDILGTITIDTTPPSVPSELVAVGRDQVVQLTWQANKESDLAGYKLFRSLTPLSGFKAVADTEFDHYEDKGLENGKHYFYKLAALDRVGNQSKTTKVLNGIPLAPGPTAVGGTILKDTTWFAGASPYIIEKEVIVADRATLTIEPGTIVRSHGGGLRVRGQLNARGTEDRMITFESIKGSWAGLVFDKTKEKQNVLAFAQIKDAKVGITCISSSPQIAYNNISENGLGLLIKDPFSRPRIVGNVISKNGGSGIEVKSSALPVIKKNRIEENKSHGILSASASPVIEENVIANNEADGIHIVRSSLLIEKNNVIENQGFNISNREKGAKMVKAPRNWWGTKDPLKIMVKILGKVDYQSPLSAPFPEGKAFDIPILTGPLMGEIAEDRYLTTAHSPYVVEKSVTIVKGATLYIQPGVVLRFNRGKVSFVIQNGAIHAKGTKQAPIRFTSNSQSPSRGDYKSAVIFMKGNPLNSFFKYCIFKYTHTALVIRGGSPDITYSLIADNLQRGIMILNDAKPKISYNTIARNIGQSAIFIRGKPQPTISWNNIVENAFSILSYSSLFIDARQNWWGKSPPDQGQFLGNIQIKPWITTPVEKAFGGK